MAVIHHDADSDSECNSLHNTSYLLWQSSQEMAIGDVNGKCHTRGVTLSDWNSLYEPQYTTVTAIFNCTYSSDGASFQHSPHARFMAIVVATVSLVFSVATIMV